MQNNIWYYYIINGIKTYPVVALTSFKQQIQFAFFCSQQFFLRDGARKRSKRSAKQTTSPGSRMRFLSKYFSDY